MYRDGLRQYYVLKDLIQHATIMQIIRFHLKVSLNFFHIIETMQRVVCINAMHSASTTPFPLHYQKIIETFERLSTLYNPK